MHKKRLMYIVTRLAPGGTLESLMVLAEGVALHYQLTMVLGEETSDLERVKAVARRCEFDVIAVKSLVREVSLLKDLTAYFALKKIIKSVKPDIVHTHTSKAGILGRLAAAACAVKKVVHTPHGHVFYGYFGALKTALIILAERYAEKYCGKIIALTESEKNDHLKLMIGTPEQFTVIPNGVDSGKFAIPAVPPAKKREELGIPSGSKVVGVVGRLAPVKGHDAFLYAFARVGKSVPNAFAVVAGDGELMEALKKKAASLGIAGSVQFLGKRNDVDELLHAFDCVAMPSLNEGFGLIAAEAGAAGKPVVAFSVGGLPEVIEDGMTGYLVAPGNISGMAEKIVYLLKDPAKCLELGLAGRRRVAEKFNLNNMIYRTIKVYEEL